MSAPKVLTPEERVERVRMALAEAGYRDASVAFNRLDDAVRVTGAPRAVTWRARFVAGIQRRCWPCADAWPLIGDMPHPCDHDPLTSPWPEVVR